MTKPEKTESDKIWEEIKDLPIAMYALPAQVLSMHVVRHDIDPNTLYLSMKSSAVIAALDEAVNTSVDRAGNVTRLDKYEIDQADGGYIIIKRAAAALKPKTAKAKK